VLHWEAEGRKLLEAYARLEPRGLKACSMESAACHAC